MARVFRAAAVSVVKHDYVARAMASHPRFELVCVADDPHVPNWTHERNQQFADAMRIPYVQGVERALRDFDVDVAIVISCRIRSSSRGRLAKAEPLCGIRGIVASVMEHSNQPLKTCLALIFL